ncbi:MAG: gliding motility-associated C-terminal domain-containing protein [Crocinitomicaceae bacterium]
MSCFAFAQADLAINPNINSPNDGCYLSNSEIITVVLVNTSGFTYSGTLEMGYVLNAGAPVTQTETIGSLPPSATFIYTFPAPDDFSACQAHDLKVWVYDSNDPNNLNDTINVQVFSDCDPVVGAISGPTTVCYNNNSGVFELLGYVGNVYGWETSLDGGNSWSTIVTSDDTLQFNNATDETILRVIVESQFGLCPNDTTAWHTLQIDQLSFAGNLPADFDICDNGNEGEITTTGYVGDILNWRRSPDNGVTWNSLSHPYDTLVYSNLINTTQYVVIAKNGVCPADTSSVLTLTLIPGTVAGTIDGESLVCNFENDSSLIASGGNGDVIAWWYSLDSGATWLQTFDTDSIYDYSSLAVSTLFRAEFQEGTCPSEFATHYITVLPLNLGIDPGDTTITEGDQIQLTASGGTSFLWWPDSFIDDVSAPNPTVSPEFDITYFVQITDINGCIDTASIDITIAPDIMDLAIPNLITPNGDGYNDTWQIMNIEIFTEHELTIFNIYGQVIYEAAPYSNDWQGDYNGNPLPDGTYFYLLTLNDPLYPDPIQGVITIAGND